jgi:hypothetical protein
MYYTIAIYFVIYRIGVLTARIRINVRWYIFGLAANNQNHLVTNCCSSQTTARCHLHSSDTGNSFSFCLQLVVHSKKICPITIRSGYLAIWFNMLFGLPQNHLHLHGLLFVNCFHHEYSWIMITWIRILKDRQHNSQKKINKRTNNDQ